MPVWILRKRDRFITSAGNRTTIPQISSAQRRLSIGYDIPATGDNIKEINKTKQEHHTNIIIVRYFLQLVSKDFIAQNKRCHYWSIPHHGVMQWNALNYGVLKGWNFCGRMIISGIRKFLLFFLSFFVCLVIFQPARFRCGGGYLCTWPQWHKPHPVGLRRSDRPVAETCTSQQTDSHVPGGNRTHNLSKRAAAYPLLRPRGHRDRLRCTRRFFFTEWKYFGGIEKLWTHIDWLIDGWIRLLTIYSFNGSW